MNPDRYLDTYCLGIQFSNMSVLLCPPINIAVYERLSLDYCFVISRQTHKMPQSICLMSLHLSSHWLNVCCQCSDCSKQRSIKYIYQNTDNQVFQPGEITKLFGENSAVWSRFLVFPVLYSNQSFCELTA